MTGILAFVAGFGVLMVVSAVGPRPVRVRMSDPDERPFLPRMLDAIFKPAAMRVMEATGRGDVAQQRAALERRLARAGYPPPFSSSDAVLAHRLFTAVIFAVFGGVFALVVGLGALALPLMTGLAVFGWAVPDRTLAKAEQERKEQLTLDGVSTLDRLAIYVAAGHALPAAVRSLAEKPGGAWVGEFRKAASRYAVTGDFQAALEEVVEASGRLPDVTRVCERLSAAYEMGGGGIAEALRRMAQDARGRIRLVLTERGYKNAVLMVIPAFFAIIATTIILIAPGAVRMVNVLGGS